MAQASQPSQLPAHPHSKPPSLITSALIGLLLFVALAGLLEGALRIPRVEDKLPMRSLGIYHAQFEIKWFKLQDYVRRNGGVDVILLGNSMVNTGINPQVLANEYKAITGEKLSIFNFGIEGLTVAPNADFTRLLMDTYHPGTLLFVTEMRDYAANNGLDVEQQLLADEWVSAQQGTQSSARVWLKSNSSFIQHLLPLRNWNRADFPDTLLMNIRRWMDTTPAGYEADRNTGENIDQPPDPNDPKEQENFALFKDYSIDPGRLQDLKTILNASSQGTHVFVTEMPLYPTYFVYFGGEPAHEDYLSTLKNFVEQNGGIFLEPLSWKLIPLEDRVDHHHLNYKGAPLFSKLLAQQLAQVCQSGGACLQPSAGMGETR